VNIEITGGNLASKDMVNSSRAIVETTYVGRVNMRRGPLIKRHGMASDR
jgi:hypothetical protein